MSPKRVLVSLLLMVFCAPLVFAQENQVTHVIQPGENLYRIALRYGISQQELARVNNITDSSRILSGQVLIIPGLSAPDAGDEVVNPLIAGTPVTHIVQPGESLTLIAQQYDTTVEQILLANNITNPNRILRGQELQIWTAETVDEAVEDMIEAEAAEDDESLVVGAAPEMTITYVVQPGEHLSQIARRYGMTWTALAELNGITDPDRVFAGQSLVIPANGSEGIDIVMPLQNARNAPTPSITNGRQIIVDLSDSRIYAFENGQLMRSVLVSTGLPATPTVQGDFTIWHRTEAQTMSGPGYYLPNVQWVQYFYQGYGIHGTYWHNNFGQPMSHGCVNLPNDEAEWFYNFGELGMAVRVQV